MPKAIKDYQKSPHAKSTPAGGKSGGTTVAKLYSKSGRGSTPVKKSGK